MIQNLRFRDAALAKRVTERIMDDLIHIPTKNAKFAWRNPIPSIAFVRSSTNDTLIITPAENPRAKPNILGVGFFMKNATAAPIVVEILAKKDSNNANETTPLTFSSPYFLVKATARALLDADGIVIRSPTYYGSMASAVKRFIDDSIK